MAIELNAPTRTDVVYIWNNVCKKNTKMLSEELSETSTPRLKAICKVMGLKMAQDKTETVKVLVNHIKKLKEEKGMDAAAAEETPVVETPAEVLVVEEPPVMQLKIKQEYYDLVPRPNAVDYANTKFSIQNNGMIEPIETLDDGTIIDGHTRFQILQELNLLPVPPEKIKVVNFESEDQIILYIYNKNVARRQLDDLGRLEWAQKFMPVIEKIKSDAKKAKAEKITGRPKKDAPAPPPKKEKEKKEHTREKIAKLAQVSPAQQARFDYLKKWSPEMLDQAKADGKKLGAIHAEASKMVHTIKEKMPEVLDQILDGKIKLQDAYNTVLEHNPNIEQEKKLGPIGSQVKDIKDFYYNKVLTKKYGETVTPDEFEMMMIQALDKRFEKFQESGK